MALQGLAWKRKFKNSDLVVGPWIHQAVLGADEILPDAAG